MRSHLKETTLRHLYATLVAAVLWLGAGGLHAAELKIGFIDAERINRESVPAEIASKRV